MTRALISVALLIGTTGAAFAEKPVDPTAGADYVKVSVSHAKPKPSDPVWVEFEKYEVKDLKLKNGSVIGGSATLEIDIASLQSGNKSRDKHIKSKDFLEVEKNAKATVKVSGVKKGKAGITATAKVTFRGVTKSWPVTIQVVEDTKEHVKVYVIHQFKREDFKVGGENSPVASPMAATALLTLKK